MSRLALFAAFAFVALCGAARADEITLDARAGAPIVDVMINDRPVRLRVDARLPDVAVIDPDAARRLRLRNIPMVTAAVSIDGDNVLQGRIARPDVRFANGRSRRVLSGLFGVDAGEDADGVIGPGALPYDRVIVLLSDSAGAAAPRVVTLRDADSWSWRDRLGPIPEASITFDFGREETFFSRRAAARLADAGAIIPEGAPARAPYVLGVFVMAQSARAAAPLASHGFSIGRAAAHTDSPLILPEDADAIVVTADAGENDPPLVHFGRETLAGCSTVIVDRAARTLTATCP